MASWLLGYSPIGGLNESDPKSTNEKRLNLHPRGSVPEKDHVEEVEEVEALHTAFPASTTSRLTSTSPAVHVRRRLLTLSQ